MGNKWVLKNKKKTEIRNFIPREKSKIPSRGAKKLTLSNTSAVGLWLGSLIRHCLTKSQNSLDHLAAKNRKISSNQVIIRFHVNFHLHGRSKNGGSDF